MIAKISGNLAYKVPGEIIVDVGGVGYHLFVSLGVFYRLPEIGGPVSLFVHTHVREDALQLFGFLEVLEKDVFLLLNGVAGIGPKLAVNILSGIPVGDLVRALKEGDKLRLVSIPGVGNRLVERMVVELRDKLESLITSDTSREISGDSLLIRDVVSALVNLGYRRPESERTVREIVKKEQGSLEDVLKQALRSLSQ